MENKFANVVSYDFTALWKRRPEHPTPVYRLFFIATPFFLWEKRINFVVRLPSVVTFVTVFLANTDAQLGATRSILVSHSQFNPVSKQPKLGERPEGLIRENLGSGERIHADHQALTLDLQRSRPPSVLSVRHNQRR